MKTSTRKLPASSKLSRAKSSKNPDFIQLHKDIAVISNDNQPIESAMKKALKRVCKETGWPVGHIYFPAEESKESLVSSFLWNFDKTERFEVFRKVTESTPLAVGVGLPGRVLKNGSPAWIRDVTKDKNFPRAKFAKNIGVRAGFAFPILISREVVGVMEFFSIEAMEPDEKLLEIMGNIGRLLGRVVERKRSEQVLKNQDKEQTIIFNSVPAMIWYVDRQFKILRINREACYFVKKFEKGVLKKNSYKVFPFQGNPGSKEDLEIIQSGEPRLGIIRSFKRDSRDLRWIQMDKVPFRDENGWVKGIIVCAVDITERKRVEEEREYSRIQLRQLYQRMEHVREEERTGIAREVHDELGQVLTTLKMELALLGKKLHKENLGYEKQTGMMLELMDNTIQTVKRISSGLRPPILDVCGIVDALKWQSHEFLKRTGIRFEFFSDPPEIHLESKLATTVFRIFQETLTNVVRHAKAKKICVDLKDKNGSLTLRVRDDGKGITKKQISDIQSLGVLGMRERALVWGGTVQLSNNNPKGTTVILTIPHEN